tara:strand:+ start:430 stop:594 length:165 start_codon:yes stop_codon:yes gene_type:complete
MIMSWKDIIKLGPRNPQVKAIAIAALKEKVEEMRQQGQDVSVLEETIRQMESGM